jgi:twitching motility protein PilT
VREKTQRVDPTILNLFDNGDEAMLADAAAAGFPVLRDASTTVTAAAARMLAGHDRTVGLEVAGDVLLVAVDHIPSPTELADLQRATGLLVTAAVTTPAVLTELRRRAGDAQTVTAGQPAAIAAALTETARLGAADLHVAAGAIPAARVAGRLIPLDGWGPLSAADVDAAARWVAGDAAFNAFTGDHDCAITYGDNRWRVNLYKQRGQTAITMRRIPSVIPRLESLTLPHSVPKFAELASGLVLVCGPTGSGKSTTLASIIDRINRTRDLKILTIEDPVEYVHSSQKSTVHQREVGEDTASFSTGLRSALRQDPDVILVGEMRDLDTMRTALTAAETGHLVFATLHATSAAEAFPRLIASFPGDEQEQIRVQVAASLRGLIVQQLLPGTTPGTRTLVCEILLGNHAVKSMIRENSLHQLGSAFDSGVSEGMTSMDRSLARFVGAGLLDEDIARQHSHDPRSFDEHLSRTSRRGGVVNGLQALDEFDDFGPDGF